MVCTEKRVLFKDTKGNTNMNIDKGCIDGCGFVNARWLTTIELIYERRCKNMN